MAESACARWAITPREGDVLRGLLAGRDNQELASRLGCSRRTIESHITRLLLKTHTRSRLELVSVSWLWWAKGRESQ